MNETTKLIERIASELRLCEELSSVEIIAAFPSAASGKAPLTPLLVLEQGPVTVKGGFLGDRVSGGRGKKAKATVKLTICSPVSAGAGQCITILSALSQKLLFDETLGLISLTAGNMKVNREKLSYELSATAQFELVIGQRETRGE